MATQRIPLTSAYIQISAGGNPRLKVRGHDNIRLAIAASQPTTDITDYFTMRSEDGPMPAIALTGGSSLWARASDAAAILELLDAGTGDGGGSNSKARYTLLAAATTTGAQVGPIAGGDYVWRMEATTWGATATLQFLGLDGVTWFNVKKADGTTDVTLTANGSVSVGVAQGSIVRVSLSAAIVGGNSVLGGL